MSIKEYLASTFLRIAAWLDPAEMKGCRMTSKEFKIEIDGLFPPGEWTQMVITTSALVKPKTDSYVNFCVFANGTPVKEKIYRFTHSESATTNPSAITQHKREMDDYDA